MTSLLVHKDLYMHRHININAIYMHRQWDSEECCIFACFTKLKIYLYLSLFTGGTQGHSYNGA